MKLYPLFVILLFGAIAQNGSHEQVVIHRLQWKDDLEKEAHH